MHFGLWKGNANMMRPILQAARRTVPRQWICNSCRGIRLASSSSVPEDSGLSPAAQQLRRRGPARTRFAPSPTGYLHLGSLRTALFNFMVAKATGGQFLLRLEDTDQKRTVPDAEERLYRDLEWAGIEWDEGPNIGGPYGPYKQSERTALYREHAERLMQTGSAYRCFCSTEHLNTRAQHRASLGLPADYDRTCAHMPKEESDDRAAKGDAHVIRLLAPKIYPDFNDLVYGRVRQRGPEKLKSLAESFDDPVLLKSDGFPTYHLANVVDDHLMDITHVIRGSEWMSSTPKHLAMYQAFGWSPPQFAHVGLLLDKDNQKLSKRTESTNIIELRDKKGIFPETLTNFVALLGWSHNARSDVMSMEDLIKNASMKFTKGETIVSLEKLWFLQKRHAARYASTQPPKPSNPSHDLEELVVKPVLNSLQQHALENPDRFSFYTSVPEGDARFDLVRSLVWADVKNYTGPDDFITRHANLFAPPTPSTLGLSRPSLTLHHLPLEANVAIPTSTFLQLMQPLYDIPEHEWNPTDLKARIDSILEKGIEGTIEEMKKENESLDPVGLRSGLKKSWSALVHSYIRWAIVAGLPGLESGKVMMILGRSESLKRLEVARDALQVVERKMK